MSIQELQEMLVVNIEEPTLKHCYALREALMTAYPVASRHTKETSIIRDFLSWYRRVVNDVEPVGTPNPELPVDRDKFQALCDRLRAYPELKTA